MRWCWVLALGACFAPRAQEGAPCDPIAPHCPDGQTCAANATCQAHAIADAIVDGIGVDGPPGDRDGDGVPDDMDNCPDISNKKQYDEDGDGLGDVCDKCPAVADAADPDRDGDGVGDKCDPHPDAPGDRLVLFDGMHDTMGWTRTGMWTATNGNAVASTALVAALTRAAPVAGTVVVSASFTLDSLTPPSMSYAGAGVIDLDDATSDAGIMCAVAESSTTGATAIVETSSEMALNAVPTTIVTGDTYLASSKRAPTTTANQYQIDCDSVHGGMPATTSSTPTKMIATPQLGFRVRAAAVHVAWIMVVAGP